MLRGVPKNESIVLLTSCKDCLVVSNPHTETVLLSLTFLRECPIGAVYDFSKVGLIPQSRDQPWKLIALRLLKDKQPYLLKDPTYWTVLESIQQVEMVGLDCQASRVG